MWEAPFAGTGLQGGEPRAVGAKQALHLICVQYVRHVTSVDDTCTDQSVSDGEFRCSCYRLLEVSVTTGGRTCRIISRTIQGNAYGDF